MKTKKSKQNDSKDLALTTIRLPLLPAFPSATIANQDIVQEMIDGMLGYDPTFREAILYLNPKKAHDKQNRAIVARFTKTYKNESDNRIWGEAEIQHLFRDKQKQEEFEKDIQLVISKQGGYPRRSIDMTPNMPRSKNKWTFEGCALAGVEKPAVPDLPSVDINEIIQLSGTVSLTVDDSKPDTSIKENNKMDLTQKDIEEAIAKALKQNTETLEKKFEEKLQLTVKEATDKIKTEAEEREKEIRSKFSSTEKTLQEQAADAFFTQKEVIDRTYSSERPNMKNVLLSLMNQDTKVQFTTSEGKEKKVEEVSVAEAYKRDILKRPVINKKATLTQGSKEDIKNTPDEEIDSVKESKEEQEVILTGDNVATQRLNLIKQVAKEKKLDIIKDFAKAEEEAMSLCQQSSNAKHLFQDELDIETSTISRRVQ